MLKIVLVFLVLINSSFAKKDESSLIDFNTIKGVIKNDMLSKEVAKKTNVIKTKKKRQQKNKTKKYDIPSNDDFWTFASEYWLVKNAPILKWDFEKPDYGIGPAFSDFLKRMGIYEKKFKILFLNTPQIAHLALPASGNELIFLISVPFMRVLDLSKLEICLLLFEDYLRQEKKFFLNAVSNKELLASLGSNFSGKELNAKVFKDVFERYDNIAYEKGFSFQEQFTVTKHMGTILKSDLKLWNTYLSLLKKIDTLVKGNVLYRDYVKIYPSPELQIGWLVPKKKVMD